MFNRENDRAHVAFDIETTGFEYSNSATVVGFWYPNGHSTLLLRVETPGAVSRDQLEATIEEETSGLDVAVRVCEGDSGLLNEVHEEIYEAFDRNHNRLVAFNAETWKGGFDLPFLRSLCIRSNSPWVFDGIQFADLYDPLKKRINTTTSDSGASADANTLDGSHQLLEPTERGIWALSERVPDDHLCYVEEPYDPFESSASAVRAYNNEEYADVLLHNLADIHRTWELGELLRMYAPPKDISTKKL